MKQLSDKKGLKASACLGEYPVCRKTSQNWTYYSGTAQDYQEKPIRGLVSVIMPVYNTPKDYLTAAVESVLRQTYGNLELLIVDDGSRPECATACDNLREYARVEVLHIHNSGVSTARNTGLDEAQGEFITFIDSDDTLAENAIQIMVEEIKDVDFVTIGCKHVQETIHEEFAGNVGSIGSTKAGQGKCIDYLCYMNPPYSHTESNAIWGKLYRKELIDPLRFDADLVMAEDFKFNFEYIMQNGNGKYIDYTGYNYLVHDDSISRKYKSAMMKTIDAIEKMVFENENTAIYNALVSRCVNIAFTILMMVPDEMKKERKRIQQFISSYRSQVIRNPQTKYKVKVACLTSYLGYWLTRKLFEINQR